MTLAQIKPPPRYNPSMPFPAYAFIPGRFPHPTHNPEGHSYGLEPMEPDPPHTDHWSECPIYLYGIDLFNYGYYWEAHEAWESLWHACGHIGRHATFLKALIKLAAAGVKVRARQIHGVRTHAQGAHEHFEQLSNIVKSDRFMGLSLSELAAHAKQVADHPFTDPEDDLKTKIVFPFSLIPSPTS